MKSAARRIRTISIAIRQGSTGGERRREDSS
jgi:hypothetical protein